MLTCWFLILPMFSFVFNTHNFINQKKKKIIIKGKLITILQNFNLFIRVPNPDTTLKALVKLQVKWLGWKLQSSLPDFHSPAPGVWPAEIHTHTHTHTVELIYVRHSAKRRPEENLNNFNKSGGVNGTRARLSDGFFAPGRGSIEWNWNWTWDRKVKILVGNGSLLAMARELSRYIRTEGLKRCKNGLVTFGVAHCPRNEIEIWICVPAPNSLMECYLGGWFY